MAPSRQEIESIMLDIISRTSGVSRDKIKLDESYIEIGFESISMIELTAVIEETFRIRLTDDDVFSVQTPSETIHLLENKLIAA